jgi:peptidoglycan hydrolase-like protein with peptidoglycan-binding domain
LVGSELQEEAVKLGRYGIAVGILAGLGACSDWMGHSSNSSQASRPVAATQPTVAPDMVKQVQAKLRDEGYYKQGNVDGVWGAGTESAVRSFQRDHNLGTSGQLDVPTLQALNVTNGPATTDNTGARNNTGATNNNAPTQPMNANPNAPSSANSNSPPANNTPPAPAR